MQLTLYNEVFANASFSESVIDDPGINLTALKIAAAVLLIVVMLLRKKLTAFITKNRKSLQIKKSNQVSETWT